MKTQTRTVILTSPEVERAKQFWRRLLRVAAVFTLAALAASVFNARFALVINETQSLPGYVYFVVRGPAPARGELLAFSVQGNAHYPDGLVWVKIVAGVAGDRVDRRARTYYVNDRPMGLAKPVSEQGEVLVPGPTGIIPPGQWFVWTPHKDSYDSRYADIGWIRQEQVVGRAHRIY